MEQPRLGVQPGRADVVGDPNLGTELDELIERRALGRVGVGGGQDPERPTRFAVAAQGVEQRLIPLRRMNAITISIASADSISDRTGSTTSARPARS